MSPAIRIYGPIPPTWRCGRCPSGIRCPHSIPDHAATYAANADAYLAELAALDTELAGLIEAIPAERRVIMTNHASLNYFAARYGLRLVGVVIPGGSTTSEPSVEDVLNLIETVRNMTSG